MAGPKDNTKIIQLRFNLNKETDRRLYIALDQSLLGATSAAVKYSVTLMLMQMQGQPQAVVPVQPQAPAPAHSASVAAPPVPTVAAESAVIKPISESVSESNIEPKTEEKPVSESQVQNDVLQSILKHNSNPENMQELASKITRHSH